MKRSPILGGLLVVVLVCSLLPAPAWAQFTQQGPKLVGTGAVGAAGQGTSVSLSGDGNTAIVGGPGDNILAGAAWIYTRAGGVWSQQAKLVGTGAVGLFPAEQGLSVSLSGDGSTAIVGGFGDDNEIGAAWVYTRSGGVWSQQAKLVGTGALSAAEQGASVSLSGDGNTAIVGGPGDSSAGAGWVFTRSAGVWSQQAKLVGTGVLGSAAQGASVSLSDDGNTAIVGGPFDNFNPIAPSPGAAWVFARSGGVWTQQAKLVGTGAVGAAAQGGSVSLSGDGNTAIVGGASDSDFAGAAWVYTRSDGVWSQQTKLVGAGAVAAAAQGASVSLSGDGNTAIVGGPSDNGENTLGFGVGATWVYTRSGSVWTQRGPKLVGTGNVGNAGQGEAISLSNDGNTAIVGGPGDNLDTGAAWVFAQPVFAGTPGKANCHGQSVSVLARQFGGLNGAAAALGFASVPALQNAILAFCGG